VWAIGTGKTATPKDADDIHRFIRDLVSRLYSEKAASGLIIQYGGSVKPNNAAELMAKEHIDGLLVGGASLAADSFVPIVRYDSGG
jgi:triosephosphate isomerase